MMSEEMKSGAQMNKNENQSKFKFTRWREALFLTTVTGFGIIGGFGTALSRAKKDDPNYFDKGFVRQSPKIESGSSLALRALKWGSFYAFAGCGVLFFALWKLSGANNLEEFRQKAGSILPIIPKNYPQGRTEFENLTELMQYISDEDERIKLEKKQNQNLEQVQVDVNKSSQSQER